MKTDWQRRLEQIEDIKLLASITDRVTLQQLESMSNLHIDVTHRIVTKLLVKEDILSEEEIYER